MMNDPVYYYEARFEILPQVLCYDLSRHIFEFIGLPKMDSDLKYEIENKVEGYDPKRNATIWGRESVFFKCVECKEWCRCIDYGECSGHNCEWRENSGQIQQKKGDKICTTCYDNDVKHCDICVCTWCQDCQTLFEGKKNLQSSFILVTIDGEQKSVCPDCWEFSI